MWIVTRESGFAIVSLSLTRCQAVQCLQHLAVAGAGLASPLALPEGLAGQGAG